MNYKGDSIVLVGTNGERSPFGAWVSIYSYEGTPLSMAALANSQPDGIKVSIKQDGPVVGVALTYAPDEFADKWEVDRENIDKDILYSISLNSLTDDGKAYIKSFRADPTQTWTVPSSEPNTTLMNQIYEMILRGTEAYQVSTLVLKRTRTMSVNLAPTIVLSEQTQFYSTARLVTLTNMDPDIAATLPTNPYAPPANTAWGWLPRQANRSYISKGQMEEHSDWVFAAWSTVLYAYFA